MPSSNGGGDSRGSSRRRDTSGGDEAPGGSLGPAGGKPPKFSSYYYNRFGSASPEEYMNLRFSHMNPKVSSDEVKDVLDDEFRRYGDFEVKLVKNDTERLAYVNFVEPDAARKARKTHLAKLAGILGRHLRIDPAGVVRDQSGRYLKSESGQGPPHMLAQGGGGPGGRGGPPRGYGGGPSRDGGYRERSPPPYHRQSRDGAPYDYRQGGGRGRYDYDDQMAPPPQRGGGGRDRRDDYRRGGGDERGGGRPSYRGSRGDPDGRPMSPGADAAAGGGRLDLETFKQLETQESSATRTLFLGNLPRDTTRDDVKAIFDQYGTLEEVDIKTPADSNAAYGFACFSTLDQALEAKYYEQDRPMRSNGQHRIKIGFGKAVRSSRLYVGGLGPWTSIDALANELDRYGLVKNIEHTRESDHAYVTFASVDAAADACNAMRGFPLGGRDRCIRVDYARELEEEVELPPRHHRSLTKERKRKRRTRSRSSSASSDASADNRGGGPRTPPPPTKRSKHRHRKSDEHSSSRRPKKGPQTPPDSPPHSPPSSTSSRRTDDGGGGRRGGAASTTGLGGGPIMTDLSAANIDELEGVRSPCWTGALVLKKSAYAVRLYKLTGDDDLIDSRLRETPPAAGGGDAVRMHVTQRLPYGTGGASSSLAERFVGNSSAQFAYLLAVTNPNASGAADLRLADSPSRPLKALIHYLNEKKAAGVVSLQQGAQVYVFPQCDFSAGLLSAVAPRLTLMKNCPDSSLLIILAKSTAATAGAAAAGAAAPGAKPASANGK